MKAVVVYSGGLDSTVLLCKLVDEGHAVHALSFNYGQKHVRELQSAKAICERVKVPHMVFDLSSLGPQLFGTTSSQVNPDVAVPDGHYADATMRVTVVPNRNMVMLALATAHALAHGCDTVAYAAHAGDHAIYPDCRQSFVDAMSAAMKLCDWKSIRLLAPFQLITKAHIVRLGHVLAVPWELTWSCYKGGEWHCGTCGTCVERREAFQLSGVEDPTEYTDAHHHHAAV